MVKSIISVGVATLLIAIGAVWEGVSLEHTFDDMISCIDQINLKLEDHTANCDDLLALQKLWISKKESLHIYIPHTEIKELDLWIAESVTYVKYEKFDEAICKLEVVKELCEQIPLTFSVKIENLL